MSARFLGPWRCFSALELLRASRLGMCRCRLLVGALGVAESEGRFPPSVLLRRPAAAEAGAAAAAAGAPGAAADGQAAGVATTQTSGAPRQATHSSCAGTCCASSALLFLGSVLCGRSSDGTRFRGARPPCSSCMSRGFSPRRSGSTSLPSRCSATNFLCACRVSCEPPGSLGRTLGIA